ALPAHNEGTAERHNAQQTTNDHAAALTLPEAAIRTECTVE
ncbi:unnamed protein product, partial [marine sediment metagenome]